MIVKLGEYAYQSILYSCVPSMHIYLLVNKSWKPIYLFFCLHFLSHEKYPKVFYHSNFSIVHRTFRLFSKSRVTSFVYGNMWNCTFKCTVIQKLVFFENITQLLVKYLSIHFYAFKMCWLYTYSDCIQIKCIFWLPVLF